MTDLQYDGCGYWLAGLLDGEASFTMHVKKGSSRVYPRMTLKLRDDDELMVRYIHVRTGIGLIRHAKEPHYFANSHPQIVWQVSSANDCHELVNILRAIALVPTAFCYPGYLHGLLVSALAVQDADIYQAPPRATTYMTPVSLTAKDSYPDSYEYRSN